jgi:hypothetical protein
MRAGDIGPEGTEIPVFDSGGFEKACQKCGESHFYKRSEATVSLGETPPSKSTPGDA